jgi:predicted permease
LGRTFSADDDRFGATKVVILSDALWRSKFAADPAALGHSIQLDGVPYEIIGVMPPDFAFPYPATQMWVPLALGAEAYAPGERGNKWLRMLARIAPGVSLERAGSMLAGVSHEVAAEDPDSYPEKTGWHFAFEPILAEQTQNIRQWLLLAFGAVACVLLIACTNVSGLLLVHASVRNREWAVRAALGASSSRLVRQILTETGLLVLSGCVAGLALAIGLIRFINLYGPIHRSQIEPWAIVFVFGLCIVSTLTAGLVPALLSSKVSLEHSLRAGAGRTSTGQSRWRAVLAASQIGIAIALLFTATALGRSFTKLLEVSPGFSPERVWTASVALPRKHDSTSESHATFFSALIERMSAVPGVESVSAGMSLPFSSGGYTADMYTPGHAEAGMRPAARVDIVLPNYFETLRIPLLKGRTFTSHDDASSAAVVVVNEEFAHKYFPRQDPVGELVANNCCHDKLATIAGVVGNVATRDLGAPPRPQIYWPELQLPNSTMFLVVREAGQTDVTSAVREILRQQEPSVALFDVETLPARIADSVKLRRFVAWLLNSFALVGMGLAALGLYGTLAYLVQLRRREIAIRMAFGATPGDIANLVGRYSLALALAGLIPGAILCVAAALATRSFLFGIGVLDPWTIVGTAAGLFAVGVIATWAPVAQAARVSTLVTLREE